jgi:uncharacterized caspase-like protein
MAYSVQLVNPILYAGGTTISAYQPQYHNSWALIIGINAYQYVSPLGYACNDADAVADILTRDLGFPKEQVTVLKDGAATKEAVLEAFHSLVKKANHLDDRIIVFYAGHGLTLPGVRAKVGFLVPVNGKTDETGSLIRWDDLTRNAELISAKHILFIMDACYSGLAMQRAVPPGTQRFLSSMLQRFARQVITAGKADEVVADGGGPQGQNSIFTGYLIEGLEGAASDENGVLTANGLMHYLYQKVAQDARSKQTPHYGHLDGDGDFVLRIPNGEHLSISPQSDLLVQPVAEQPEISQSEQPAVKPTFATRNGYGDPTHPSFGRNDWSSRLGELRGGENYSREMSKAFSWLSLIVEPVSNQPLTVNIAENVMPPLPNEKPFLRFQMPPYTMTTSDSRFLFDTLDNEDRYWGRYLRIEKRGNIEYAISDYPIFRQWKDLRIFQYIQIVGTVWRFLFLAKHLLSVGGYTGEVEISVNLVGTRDTLLGDFSRETGEDRQHWSDPFEAGGIFFSGRSLQSLQCSDSNLQMKYQVVLANLNEANSFNIVRDVAQELGLAYNHQSRPRCFNYNTEIFPWSQYREG